MNYKVSVSFPLPDRVEKLDYTIEAETGRLALEKVLDSFFEEVGYGVEQKYEITATVEEA